ELRRLLYKLDFRIIPLILFCYMLSFMDRVNIGNAKVAGLTDMIDVTEDDYNTALSIFFLGYVLFDIPSNVVLNKLGPRLWISIIIVLCGGCGFAPAMFFYISLWYTKAEMTKRVAILMSCNVIASIFGGLLAYGCMFLDTIQGLRNWQWIFIIEGALTVVAGIVLFIFLPDFPEKDTSFLNERERILHRNHMAAAINTPSYYIFEGEKQQFDKHSKEFILLAIKDYLVYVYGFIDFCGSVLLYNNSTFLPSIVHGMGFSSLSAQLMIIPPSAIAAIVTITIAFNADRTRERGFHIFGVSLISVLGYALLIGLKDKGTLPLYIAVILVTMGGVAVSTCVISWLVCNMAGRAKRSTATAILVTCGNVSGALSGQIYRASDAP
ncbi:major facilitator superfamily domain-containing protein, partial [Circinella umbellata]